MTEPGVFAAVSTAVERERAKLNPVQRLVADEISRVAGHVLLYGELPPDLDPGIRRQLEQAMQREGLLP
jgi:hypothetical protein